MSGRSVFVTGAYGLLGTWLVRALLEREERVVVLRRREAPGSMLATEGLEVRCAVVDGDVLDGASLSRALADHECDTVFHLAARFFRGSGDSPADTFEVNARGTWMVLEACRELVVPRVVVASTDRVYGPHGGAPYVEGLPLRGSGPYDASKAVADTTARSYWDAYRVPVAVLRFSNVYGGGDRHLWRLIPAAVSAAFADRAPAIRSDGTPERDFVYVEDAVSACLAVADALDADEGAVRGQAFNAGSGQSRSVREVVSLVYEIAGSGFEPEIRSTDASDEDADRQVVDVTKIRERLGWSPTTPLAKGLRNTVEWYRRNPETLRA